METIYEPHSHSVQRVFLSRGLKPESSLTWTWGGLWFWWRQSGSANRTSPEAVPLYKKKIKDPRNTQKKLKRASHFHYRVDCGYAGKSIQLFKLQMNQSKNEENNSDDQTSCFRIPLIPFTVMRKFSSSIHLSSSKRRVPVKPASVRQHMLNSAS